MYNKQLETFMLAAQTKSFSRAAEQLFISSSAVIQQMNNLEKDLKVTLFKRSRHGLELTAAGEYLKEECREYIQKGNQIRQRLEELSHNERIIHVGTSLLEKCRLLFDLWMLYQKENGENEIKLILSDKTIDAFGNAELVESVRDGADWQTGWEFLEFQKTPIGCAMARTHPLYNHTVLSPEDLKGQTVVIIDRGWKGIRKELDLILQRNQVSFTQTNECSASLIWECSVRQWIMIIPLCWSDVFFDMKTIPCSWPFALSYGLFFREDRSSPLMEFLAFVKKVYYAEDYKGPIPVL